MTTGNETRYRVKQSSWLMPLFAAVFIGAVALLMAVLPFLFEKIEPALVAIVVVVALVSGTLAAWVTLVGLRTRPCAATLSADHIDVTTFRLVRGRGTRQLVSARIPWADVQSLVTESYDLKSGTGVRMPLRNLFVFSRQGDFVFYGTAWKDWETLQAEIVDRSGRQLNAPAAERAQDVQLLNRYVRRNFRLLRAMSWISIVLFALLMLVRLL